MRARLDRPGAARATFVLLFLMVAGGTARAEQGYWITELGTSEAPADYWTTRLNQVGDVATTLPGGATLLSGGSSVTLGRSGASYVIDLNDQSQVLGADGQGLFLYEAGTCTAVEGMVTATDLANGGVVCGTTIDPADPLQQGRAAVWFAGTLVSIHALLEPMGAVSSEATSVNSYGEVVGYFQDAAGYRRPYFFYGGEYVTPLEGMAQLIQSEDGWNTALNENGMVAGEYANAVGETTLAYSWFGWNFDIFSRLEDGSTLSYTRGMNERNDAYGVAHNGTWGEQHGFLFTYDDQQVREVPSLGANTCVHGFNNRGEVVGHSNLPGNAPYLGDPDRGAPGPNVLFKGGVAHDLNALIPPGSGFMISTWSGKINDLGQIVVRAFDEAGVERPILLNPLPVTSIAFAGTLRADGWYASNVSVTLSASDSLTGIGELRYRIDAGPWLIVKASSATFAISQSGTHRVSYYAIDAKGHAASQQDSTVSIDKGGVVLVDRDPPHATTGVPYSNSLTARGGTAPYTFRVSAGSLPPGLTLATTGLLSGTPTTAGTHWAQVLVSDRYGASSRSFLSIDVFDPLTITTPSQVSGIDVVGLDATGGKAPYTWSIDPATPLPEGKHLSHATIYGYLLQALPSVTVNVTATDAVGNVATAPITLDFVTPLVISVTGETTVQDGAQVSIGVHASGGYPPTTTGRSSTRRCPRGSPGLAWGWGSSSSSAASPSRGRTASTSASPIRSPPRRRRPT